MIDKLFSKPLGRNRGEGLPPIFTRSFLFTGPLALVLFLVLAVGVEAKDSAGTTVLRAPWWLAATLAWLIVSRSMPRLRCKLERPLVNSGTACPPVLTWYVVIAAPLAVLLFGFLRQGTHSVRAPVWLAATSSGLVLSGAMPFLWWAIRKLVEGIKWTLGMVAGLLAKLSRIAGIMWIAWAVFTVVALFGGREHWWKPLNQEWLYGPLGIGIGLITVFVVFSVLAQWMSSYGQSGRVPRDGTVRCTRELHSVVPEGPPPAPKRDAGAFARVTKDGVFGQCENYRWHYPNLRPNEPPKSCVWVYVRSES
jgi:hypothetical protein